MRNILRIQTHFRPDFNASALSFLDFRFFRSDCVLLAAAGWFVFVCYYLSMPPIHNSTLFNSPVTIFLRENSYPSITPENYVSLYMILIRKLMILLVKLHNWIGTSPVFRWRWITFFGEKQEHLLWDFRGFLQMKIVYIFSYYSGLTIGCH